MNEFESKSNDLNVLKHQMVNVINKLKSCHDLNEIMPLVNLLKSLQNYISAINISDFQEWDSAKNDEMKYKLGSEKINLIQKLCFLFNRIRIEGAYVSSLNKSIAYGLKSYYTNKDINTFVKQKSTSLSKKRLFIISLNLLLRENLTVNTSGLPLDKITNLLLSDLENEMKDLHKMIHDGCTVCDNNHDVCKSKSNQFCFCKLKSTNLKENRCYNGVLKFKFSSFMGMYEASYLEKILHENAPRLIRDQFSCDANNKIKRKCGITVKEKSIFSDWTTGTLSVSGNIDLINAKEIEIQVWESSSKQESSKHIVSVAVVPLQSIIEAKDPTNVNISMEPEGCTVGDIIFIPSKSKNDRDTNKENKPEGFLKVKRRTNILTKLTGHRLQRHVEANIPVSLWLDWFQNHIDRLAIPVDANNKNLLNDKEARTLGFNNKKILITPCKTPLLKKIANESYRQVSKSPVPERIITTPKLNQTNPRAVCKISLTQEVQFANQEAVSNLPEEQIISKDFVMSTPIQNKSKNSDNPTPFFKIENVNPGSVLSPILVSNFQNPKRCTKYINDGTLQNKPKAVDMLQKTMFMADASLTRSNIELTNLEDPISYRSYKSDSVLCSKNDSNESENRANFRQATLFSKNVLRSPFPLDSRIDYIPDCNSQTSFISNSRTSKKHDKSQISKGSHLSENENSLVMNSYQQGIEVSDPRSDRSLYNDRNDDNDDDCDDSDNDGNVDACEEDDGSDTEHELDINHRSNILKITDLKLMTVLGQGHFGKVLLAQVTKTQKLCAIKSIQKVRASTDTEYESLSAERRILMLIRKFKHPFFVNLIGCFQTERYLFFAMEYVAGGDFMGHVHEKPFEEKHAKFHLACIVLAFDFLHKNDIIYRDLKLDNVLMDHLGYAKLTDFGLSKQGMKWNTVTNTFCGTPEFLAPEIIDQQNYTRVIDWWALGVLTYEMIVGESPFPGEEDDEIFKSILNSSPDVSALSVEAVSLVKRLLKRNPEKRLGYGENGSENVKAHPFFKSIDWIKLYNRELIAPFVPQLDHDADTKYFEKEFTDQMVTFEHEDEDYDQEIIDEMFIDFDSEQQWII